MGNWFEKNPFNDNNNYEEVLQGVKKNGRYLSFASEELKKNRTIILEASKQTFLALKYVEPSILNDKDFFLEILKATEGSIAFEYTNQELKKDKEFVKKVVE